MLGFDCRQTGAGERVVTPIDAWPAPGFLRWRFNYREVLKRLSSTGRLDDPLRRRTFTVPTVTEGVAIPHSALAALVLGNRSGNIFGFDTEFSHSASQVGDNAFALSLIHPVRLCLAHGSRADRCELCAATIAQSTFRLRV